VATIGGMKNTHLTTQKTCSNKYLRWNDDVRKSLSPGSDTSKLFELKVGTQMVSQNHAQNQNRTGFVNQFYLKRAGTALVKACTKQATWGKEANCAERMKLKSEVTSKVAKLNGEDKVKAAKVAELWQKKSAKEAKQKAFEAKKRAEKKAFQAKLQLKMHQVKEGKAKLKSKVAKEARDKKAGWRKAEMKLADKVAGEKQGKSKRAMKRGHGASEAKKKAARAFTAEMALQRKYKARKKKAEARTAKRRQKEAATQKAEKEKMIKEQSKFHAEKEKFRKQQAKQAQQTGAIEQKLVNEKRDRNEAFVKNDEIKVDLQVMRADHARAEERLKEKIAHLKAQAAEATRIQDAATMYRSLDEMRAEIFSKKQARPNTAATNLVTESSKLKATQKVVEGDFASIKKSEREMKQQLSNGKQTTH